MDGGPGWFSAFLFLNYNPIVLIFIPLVVPLASAAAAEAEIKSRFVLFACICSGRKQYFWGKSIALILTGGVLVYVAMLILFGFAYVGFHNVAWMNGNEYNVRTPGSLHIILVCRVHMNLVIFYF